MLMNLQHFHYLRLVIREGSFAAAAKAAHVSQPAITQAMQALETSLGLPLFEWHGQRKRPGPTAFQLVKCAEDLEERVAAIRAAAHDSGGPSDLVRQPIGLRFGMSPGTASLYGPLIVRVWQGLGGIRGPVQMSNGSSPELVRALLSGELDLVVSPRPRGELPPELLAVTLFHGAGRIYARRGHPMSGARSLSDLEGVGWVVAGTAGTPGYMIEEAHRVRGFEPIRIDVRCAEYGTLLHLVSLTDLMGVVPYWVFVDGVQRERVRPLAIREGLPRYEVCAFTKRGTRGIPDGELQALVEALRNDEAARVVEG
ncbi:MAG: LysR family transcriptional regulator [Lautropia sp.]